MKRRIILLVIVFQIFSLLIVSLNANANESETSYQFTESLYARSAVLMDAESGRVLFGKNAEEVLPMASTTKIMTCILALEMGNLEDTVTVSKKASSMPKVKLYMKEGEQYYLKDLLYSLMLESHNDTAVAIAEHIGGSMEGFAKLMNQKARDLHCHDTFFITPNGLDATINGKQHATTATDLAKVMSYCIIQSPKAEDFLSITQTSTYAFSNIVVEGKSKRSFHCTNHNQFLSMMEGALSGKTGFTGNAGYCYVGALKRDDKTFVVALLACGWPNNKSYKWSDTRKLMEYGIDNYYYQSFKELVINENSLGSIRVLEGQGEKINDLVYSKIEIIDTAGLEGLLLRNDEKIVVEIDVPKEVTAPVKKGEQIGAITYSLNGKVWKQKGIVIMESIEQVNLFWCIQSVIRKYCF